MPELLSLHSGAREPQSLRLCAAATEVCMPRAQAPQQEKPVHRQLESSPHSPQSSSAPASSEALRGSPDEGEISRPGALTLRDEPPRVEDPQLDTLYDFGLATHPLVPECP